MATYTITQTASTESQAEGAVLGIIGDVSTIDGVGEPNIVVQEEGGTFLAVATITIPDDVKLDDVQKERLARYTDLDEKSAELETDFEQAENNEAKDLTAEAVAAAAMARMEEDARLDDSDTIQEDQLENNNTNPEDEITIDENEIGQIEIDPAPELDEKTVAVAGAAEETADNKDEEPKMANLDREPEPQNKKKQKPEDDLEPEVA
jgi:hypothetical protein